MTNPPSARRKGGRSQGEDGTGGGTASPEEVARFVESADAWWDADGSYRPLHDLNPVRLAFIRDRVAQHFRRDPLGVRPLRGLRLLDVGCGGGLLCEPMCRLGARVTGIDAAEQNVRVAADHARLHGLRIRYRSALPEDLTTEAMRFHVVLNMEVVEHVRNLDAFLAACCTLVEPGGVMVLSTINRTLKAWRWPRWPPSTCCGGCRPAPTIGASSSARPNWRAGSGRTAWT